MVRRQRNTEYLDVRVLRKEESHPSPPRADIEDLLARLQRELGGDMSELVLLRHFQRIVGVEEIRARIIEVIVEEESVQLVGEIVVVGDVCA